jgi:hypothetical protein
MLFAVPLQDNKIEGVMDGKFKGYSAIELEFWKSLP